MNTPRFSPRLITGLLAIIAAGLSPSSAQEATSAPPATAKKEKAGPVFDRPQAPQMLPGKGLMQHDFLLVAHLAARANKSIQIVRGGRVVWSYSDPSAQGPYSDATLLPNGNVLFAHGFGVRIVRPDKEIVWAVRAWSGDTNLGPATTIQLLDDPIVKESLRFGSLR